ncbi:16S rRNA (adenine(1518)-N(6)/adenine(1519)-N(6))-dimethyltransferase RsmA [Thermosyntropha sp.]|uniref:16S rRNA (adenine(1518)-N(6)/adenine(1519)-N(6))- dimethyltransferase RsmA n=1 Tax=Thermosyntropha sp. TaxID=2740820 RepID=UPI0025F2F464|nr:16S rRNA (adenine(1518)-N(6)/adenine(1519)-N(6))-dimethyltransferase RsmA [Thermosyntropha sp.]MBO8159971.1 ribosomal RNA small subunit methyltransferase A [Thermosyntropha sp.]
MENTTSLSAISRLMKDYKLMPRKKWGQNFLVDSNIIKKIVNSAPITEEDYIVEIGPGLGALTCELASKSRGVMAVDIDTSLKEPLEKILEGYNNTRVVFEDILKLDIENELARVFNLENIPPYKVCANIPYNITTPIIFKLLEESSHMISATLMMQKEVAERILAKPGNKDYGLLTLMVRYYGEAEFLLNVSRNCFYPRPEVDSTVIRITPLAEKRVKVKDEQKFKEFIKKAFQMRRKTILNIASFFFKVDKETARNELLKISILPDKRPEDLTIEQFALIADVLS